MVMANIVKIAILFYANHIAAIKTASSELNRWT